ncbi:MAG: metalloregulator ArsR/SmtB family transcription factor [Leptospirales bacterium]|jgi:ArsR family transcriptional regulator
MIPPETQDAAACLAALGNPARLEIVRLLVQAGPAGAPVNALQTQLEIPASTLSHHLSKLTGVGLMRQERESRVLRCHLEFDRIQKMTEYLLHNCCGGL